MAAFGRVLDHHPGQDRDVQNKLYGVRRLRAAPAPPRSRFWAPGPALLDQLKTGHCGGFAAANEAQASPVRVRGVTNEWAHAFYYEIKRRGWDPWALEDGTSTQAVARLAVARTLAASYVWAFGVEDLYRQLEFGPVLCGTGWLTGMFAPNEDGVIEPTGQVEGGHLWLCTGRYTNYRGPSRRTYGPAIRLRNSWGEWGRHGSAVMPEDAAQEVVFGQDGEAACLVERRLPPRE